MPQGLGVPRTRRRRRAQPAHPPLIVAVARGAKCPRTHRTAALIAQPDGDAPRIGGDGRAHGALAQGQRAHGRSARKARRPREDNAAPTMRYLGHGRVPRRLGEVAQNEPQDLVGQVVDPETRQCADVPSPPPLASRSGRRRAHIAARALGAYGSSGARRPRTLVGESRQGGADDASARLCLGRQSCRSSHPGRHALSLGSLFLFGPASGLFSCFFPTMRRASCGVARQPAPQRPSFSPRAPSLAPAPPPNTPKQTNFSFFRYGRGPRTGTNPFLFSFFFFTRMQRRVFRGWRQKKERCRRERRKGIDPKKIK